MSEKTAFDAMMDDASTTAAPSQATATDQASGNQARDDAGRFAKAGDPPVTDAPAASAPASQSAPAATPSAEPQKQEAIPLATALEWRDQAKAFKRELEQLKTQQRPSEPAPEVPSATQDPEGFASYMADLANRTRMNTVFEVSEAMATEKHGTDAVKGAMEWAMEQAQASPSFAAEYLRQKHPIDWAVKQQKRFGLMSQIGDDEESYIRRRAAELGLTAPAPQPEPQPSQAAPQPQAAQPAPSAPRSIASMPSAGSQHSVPSGPGKAFEAAFQT